MGPPKWISLGALHQLNPARQEVGYVTSAQLIT